MRVALVCPYDWGAHGGVRAHVAALAEALAAEHDVLVVAPSSSGHPGDEGVGQAVELATVGPTRALRFNDSVARVAVGPGALRRTTAALRAWAPDVVHVHEPLVPWVALAATARGPRPLVGTFHAWSTRARAYRLSRPMARRFVARLDARLAVSPVAARYAATALGLDPVSFEIVPNGVDAAGLGRALPDDSLVEPERPLVAFVGRLERRKGVVELVRAFNLLRDTHPHARLVVAGDGPERALAEEEVRGDARADVRFVGAVSEVEKTRLLASADVYVAPNLGGESFGIVLLEAMAVGLPVVASDLPGFRAVCRDDVEGVLVAPGQPTQLAEAVAGLLDDPHRRKRLAAAGRERAAAHDWPRIAADVAEVYACARERATRA